MNRHVCGYCGEHFAEDQGQQACASCPLKGGCHFVRCPKCGYENPCTPEWMARLRAWLGTIDARAAGHADERAPQDAREAQRAR
jgi:hypothetical protein